MVYRVVGSVRGPTGSKAEDRGGKGKDGAGLGFAHAHRDIGELAGVHEFAEHDQEDDEAGDPTPKLVRVDNLIAEESDEEGCCRNDDNARPSWNVAVYGIEDLSANDDIDGGPSDACEDVEEGD